MGSKKIFILSISLLLVSFLSSCSSVNGKYLPSGKEEESQREVIKTSGIKVVLGYSEVYDNVGYISCLSEITPYNATDRDVIWTSSDVNIARYQYGNLIIGKVSKDTVVTIKATYKNNSSVFGEANIKVKPFVDFTTDRDLVGKCAVRIKLGNDGGAAVSYYAVLNSLRFVYNFDSYSRFSGVTTAVAKAKIISADEAQYYNMYSQINVKAYNNKTLETSFAFSQVDQLVPHEKGDEFEMSFSFPTPSAELGYSFVMTANQ